MKKIIFLIIVFVQCASPSTKVPAPDPHLNELTKFFSQSELDIHRAKKVIIDYDIVKNLTHLQKMDRGGKKYYLLERESITKMIESVTKGVYSDFILINMHGKIIYTMKNDVIFGKNVRRSLRETSLNKCYENRNNDIYLEDVSNLPDNPEEFIFFSTKVTGGRTFPGILVLQINIKKIKSLLTMNTNIIGYDGNYRISYDKVFNTRYKHFNKINLNENNLNRFQINDNTLVLYNRFNYKNISWIVLSERSL